MKVKVNTSPGEEGVITYQVADISRTLTSAARIADLGNTIVLNSEGGYIQCKRTKAKTRVHRRGNVYTLELMACPF